MKYHKAHLTRRLILDTSADNEKEENMVEWLRVCITCLKLRLKEKHIVHLLIVMHKSPSRFVTLD